MRQYTPDASDLSAVPSGMDNDPRADEEVINQQNNEMHPADQSAAEPPERLATLDSQSSRQDISNAIANALDGSGTGIVGSTPQVGEPQKVLSEGITGASLEDEEENLTR